MIVIEDKEKMKKIYIFDLDDSESDDFHEVKIFDQARNLHDAMADFNQHMRSELKYNDSLSEGIRDYLDKLQDKFWAIMDEYHVDMSL